MKTPIVGSGVVLLIIGIIIAALYPNNTSALYGGIGVLVIGIIVAGAGAVIGPKKTGMAGGMAMKGQGGMGMGSGSMDDMVRMLATSPEDQRKSMITARLQMFVGMPEDQRQMSIKGLMTAISKLPSDQKRRFIRTRNEVIGELSEDQRMTIMKSRMAAMKDARDIDMADMQITEQVMPEIPEGPRMAFARSIKALKESMPMM